MAFAATFSQAQPSFSNISISAATKIKRRRNPPFQLSCQAVKPSSDNKLQVEEDTKPQQQPPTASASTNSQSATSPPPPGPTPKKTVYSMKKGQIVRVDKDKYLNSVNYLSVGHPPYYKGLEYIYEDRGEVLDIRVFETGEYALIGWVGIPTAPAWLPTEMLIKSDKLDYERL